MKLPGFILFLLVPFVMYGQTSKHLPNHYRIIEDKFEIWYDMPVNHDSVEIVLVFYKTSDPKFKYYPKYVVGELGKGIFSGKNKKITWSFKKEPKYLFNGSGYKFDVIAISIPKREE